MATMTVLADISTGPRRRLRRPRRCQRLCVWRRSQAAGVPSPPVSLRFKVMLPVSG